MSKVNPVFRVLTTSGNTAVLPVGNRTEALAVGQIGIFSNETNLSLGAASAMQDSRKFYIAVKQADGEIIKSAGFGIQRSNISAYTAQCYNPFQPKVIDIHGFKAICDTTYGIKFGYRSQQLFKDQGFQTKMQTISVKAANCEGCDPCPSGDCIALAKQLVAALTASGNFTVQYVDYETNPGTPAIVADVDAWATANPTLCIGIRLTGKQEGIFAYCGVNPLYNNPRGIGFDAYLLDGFEEGGTVSTVQEMMFEEGAGYDIRHQEEIANGWEYGPYRTSELTGLSNAGPTYATADSYNQIAMTYTHKHNGGNGVFEDNMQTQIAIPCGDNTTQGSFIALLDALVSKGTGQFGPLEDDMAACDCTTAVEASAARPDADGDA